MPFSRAKHCSILVDDNTVFIFGGQTAVKARSSLAQLYDIKRGEWTFVPDRSPCRKIVPQNHYTPCGLVKTKKETNDTHEIIIPTMNEMNESCTAILMWPSLNWTRMNDDLRPQPLGGHVLTFANRTRLLYLGGAANNFEKGLRTIYEYEGQVLGWRRWANSLPVPLSDNYPFAEMDPQFCIDYGDFAQKMTHLDPRGEFQGTLIKELFGKVSPDSD